MNRPALGNIQYWIDMSETGDTDAQKKLLDITPEMLEYIKYLESRMAQVSFYTHKLVKVVPDEFNR